MTGRIVVVLLTLSFTAPALADLITFNGTEGDGQNTNRPIGFIYTEGDWQYEVITTQIFTLDNSQGGFDAADDDLVFFQNNGSITFIHVAGLVFDALNVDSIGGFSDGNGTLLFTGHFDGGGTIALAVPVSHGVITNTDLAGFAGLTSLDVVQIVANGNFLALDNIELILTPAPAGLLTFGIAGLFCGRRRRH